jgi:hypothetical protein
MKTIYMDQTIRLIASQDPAYAQELIKSGTVKETEDKLPYLVIEE